MNKVRCLPMRGGTVFFMFLGILFFLTIPSIVTAREHYSVAVRMNFRVYEGRSYEGLLSRQAVGRLTEETDAKGVRIRGEFYLFEETKRDALPVAAKVSRQIPVSYLLLPSGKVNFFNKDSMPPFYGFPHFSDRQTLAPGDTWEDQGVYLQEPPEGGTLVEIPILCRYKVIEEVNDPGKEGFIVKADYALRYDEIREDTENRKGLSRVRGRHEAEIFIGNDGSQFITIQAEEQYEYSGTPRITLKGFILMWKNISLPMDREKTAEELEKETGIPVETEERGVKLILEDLHFYPDSTDILPGDLSLVQKIAESLGKMEKRSFLIEGHTADVGSRETQLKLSEDRARKVGKLLIEGGVDPDRIMYIGYGGDKPVAPNDTEINMARNRRVEIIVLE